MDKQLLLILKRKLDDLTVYGEIDVETKRNVLKEELQYHILNGIYHHQDYRRWVMYGGSALRICHGLNRMSVDLDFEIDHPCTDNLLQTLKARMLEYFSETYGLGDKLLTIKINHGRGIRLNFLIGDELGVEHHSKQVHVKIDLNHFVARHAVVERIPITHDQLSFVIVIYNMSALMASKIAAIFLRSKRGIGKALYEEKGRDIYDLLWYMEKKVIPDIDYLASKGVEVKDMRALFDRLTIAMNKVSDINLRQDLMPLFMEYDFIAHWLQQWRAHYMRLLEAYRILTVTKLRAIVIRQERSTDNYFFHYIYDTEEGRTVQLVYALSDYWIIDREGELPTKINHRVIGLVSGDWRDRLNNRLKQYVTLFHGKMEIYLKKTKHVVIGDKITTKLIRMTADHLNQNTQIMLNRSALLSSEFDDLFI